MDRGVLGLFGRTVVLHVIMEEQDVRENTMIRSYFSEEILVTDLQKS